jgi:DNA-binding XRE family transcriptional regulator
MTSRKHRSRDRDKNIGAALRHHRIARGLSQSKLGDMIDVCRQQIQKYENGTDRLAASMIGDMARSHRAGESNSLASVSCRSRRPCALRDRRSP